MEERQRNLKMKEKRTMTSERLIAHVGGLILILSIAISCAVNSGTRDSLICEIGPIYSYCATDIERGMPDYNPCNWDTEKTCSNIDYYNAVYSKACE